MAAVPISFGLPWAVHISDGILTAPWLLGGFALAGMLAYLAANRVRDEEIPRIAVLTAAFFVASLMHVRLGPTTVHLLLNGLVGVVLGRRAPLAILIGLGLQAALLGHGGFTTLGINACVLTLPALLAGWMFSTLCRLSGSGWKKTAVLWTFGCLIGMISVLATLLLNAAVLLWGAAEDWHTIVWLVFFAHLPIVGLEGIVLGFTVSFLVRVKPEMLAVTEDALRKWQTSKQRFPAADELGIAQGPANGTSSVVAETDGIRPPLPSPPPALLLAALTTLWFAGPAQAHRPQADYTVLPDRQIRIEGWFDPAADPMRGAKVQVFRPEQRLLVEGQLDEGGQFVFRYSLAEPLEVVVSAGAGHRTSFVIPREKLEREAEPPRSLEQRSAWGERLKDALLGVTFLLALGAFLLSWRNGQKLKAMQQIGSTGSNPKSGLDSFRKAKSGE